MYVGNDHGVYVEEIYRATLKHQYLSSDIKVPGLTYLPGFTLLSPVLRTKNRFFSSYRMSCPLKWAERNISQNFFLIYSRNEHAVAFKYDECKVNAYEIIWKYEFPIFLLLSTKYPKISPKISLNQKVIQIMWSDPNAFCLKVFRFWSHQSSFTKIR